MKPDHEPPGAHDLHSLKLRAGRLCLNFANTVDPRVGEQPPHDYVADFAALVEWGCYVGMLTEGDAKRLADTAAQDPVAAHEAYRRAITLREALYRTFAAESQDLLPSPADLGVIQEGWISALAHAQIVPGAGGFGWSWGSLPDALDAAWWPIAQSATDLLMSADVRRVHRCPASDCGWLFLDTSRKGNRKWCSMESCGNRAKARRHYALRLTQDASPTRTPAPREP